MPWYLPGMVTFEQARETVRRALADPSFEPAAHGFADDEDYLVPVRAVFPAPDLDGGQLYLVDRETGRLRRANYLADAARYDSMVSTSTA